MPPFISAAESRHDVVHAEPSRVMPHVLRHNRHRGSSRQRVDGQQRPSVVTVESSASGVTPVRLTRNDASIRMHAVGSGITACPCHGRWSVCSFWIRARQVRPAADRHQCENWADVALVKICHSLTVCQPVAPYSGNPAGVAPSKPTCAPSFLASVSYTHLRAHETVLDLVCRLLLEKKQLQ